MLADACPENWRPHLLDTLNGDIGRHIQAQLNAEFTGGYVYFPPARALFSALEGLYSPLPKVCWPVGPNIHLP